MSHLHNVITHLRHVVSKSAKTRIWNFSGIKKKVKILHFDFYFINKYEIKYLECTRIVYGYLLCKKINHK